MPNIDILIMAIIRGVSEILPIDPGAHGLLLSRLTCWPERGELLTAAADFGILIALLLYFWRDIIGMLRSLVRSARGKHDPNARLLLHVIVASIPSIVIVFVLRQVLSVTLSDPIYVAVLLVAFAVVLYVADQVGLTVRGLDQMKLGQAFVIGLFQGLAALPGVSRMGVALTVTRILGYERVDAARFTFLLAIPWVAASGLFRAYLGVAAREAPDADRMLMMATGAGVTAFLAIAFLMYWVRRGTFTLFAVYRVALGGALIYALYALPQPPC